MIINSFEHQNNNLMERNKKLREEYITLIQTRDRILNDIKDQRQWNTEVYNNKVIVWKELDTLESILSTTTKVVEKQRIDFYKLTDKQKNNILDLSNKINSKLNELKEYDKKEILDIDSINKDYKLTIQKQWKKLNEVKNKIAEIKKEKEEFEKYKKEIEIKLEKEIEDNKITRINLNKEIKKLNLKEKRLKKLSLELNK